MVPPFMSGTDRSGTLLASLCEKYPARNAEIDDRAGRDLDAQVAQVVVESSYLLRYRFSLIAVDQMDELLRVVLVHDPIESHGSCAHSLCGFRARSDFNGLRRVGRLDRTQDQVLLQYRIVAEGTATRVEHVQSPKCDSFKQELAERAEVDCQLAKLRGVIATSSAPSSSM